MRLTQRLGLVRHVADAEGDRIGVERAVVIAQGFGVLRLPAEALDAALLRPLHADGEHVLIDVTHHDLRAPGGHAEGDVAGATGHVEDRFARARLHPADELVLPQPMHARGHGIVHDVIILRDAGEDVADKLRLLFGRHLAIAEGDGLAGCWFAHGAGSSGVFPPEQRALRDAPGGRRRTDLPSAGGSPRNHRRQPGLDRRVPEAQAGSAIRLGGPIWARKSGLPSGMPCARRIA